MKFFAIFLALLLLPLAGRAQSTLRIPLKLLINPALIFDLPLEVAIGRNCSRSRISPCKRRRIAVRAK